MAPPTSGQFASLFLFSETIMLGALENTFVGEDVQYLL